MPRLYEYFGLIVRFYSNEHEPIHVHGRYQDMEGKAEIIVADGVIVEIRFRNIPTKRPLRGKPLADFKTLVRHEAESIVKSWNEFFREGKKPRTQIITRRFQ
ncbi:MAG: DUF4160 domain-containing protein [Candidatus Kapaibacterium sp.]